MFSIFQSYNLEHSNGAPGYVNQAYKSDNDVTPVNDVKIPIEDKKNGAIPTQKPSRKRGESVTLEEENWDVVELEDTTTPWKGRKLSIW